MSKRYLLNIAVIFAIMAIPVHVYAYTVFEAELLGANTIPQSGSAATGTATFVLNEAQTQVFYIVEVENLEGLTELATLVQNAGPGENGPVFFMMPKGGAKDGVWNVGPFEVNELMNGRVYVAVYTDLHPTGEIRGNLSELASPTEESSWGAVKALY